MTDEHEADELPEMRVHQLAALGAAQLLGLVVNDLARLVGATSVCLSVESAQALRSDLLELAANATRIGTALELAEGEAEQEASMQ